MTCTLSTSPEIDKRQRDRELVDEELASAEADHVIEGGFAAGLGGYWASSITTVESRGAVTVRPVWTDPKGMLVRSMYESPASWYAGQHFQFLVYQMPVYQGVDSVSATKTWGRPAQTYAVGDYHVLVCSVAFSVAPFPQSSDQARVTGRPAGVGRTDWQREKRSSAPW